MGFVFGARSANSSFVEMVWHTHSERAGTFASTAVSNREVVITTFNGKTISSREVQRQKHRKSVSPPTLSSFARALLYPSRFTCKSKGFRSGAEGIRTPDLRRAKADT